MKYLIAASAPSLDAKIAKRFGHAPYYLLLDPETYDFVAIEGPGSDAPSYRIGRFAGKGVDRVLLGNVGPQAFNSLASAGWSVYSCIGVSVREAVDRVRNGAVPILEAPTMKRSIRSGPGGTGGRREGGIASRKGGNWK